MRYLNVLLASSRAQVVQIVLLFFLVGSLFGTVHVKLLVALFPLRVSVGHLRTVVCQVDQLDRLCLCSSTPSEPILEDGFL